MCQEHEESEELFLEYPKRANNNDGKTECTEIRRKSGCDCENPTCSCYAQLPDDEDTNNQQFLWPNNADCAGEDNTAAGITTVGCAVHPLCVFESCCSPSPYDWSCMCQSRCPCQCNQCQNLCPNQCQYNARYLPGTCVAYLNWDNLCAINAGCTVLNTSQQAATTEAEPRKLSKHEPVIEEKNAPAETKNRTKGKKGVKNDTKPIPKPNPKPKAAEKKPAKNKKKKSGNTTEQTAAIPQRELSTECPPCPCECKTPCPPTCQITCTKPCPTPCTEFCASPPPMSTCQPACPPPCAPLPPCPSPPPPPPFEVTDSCDSASLTLEEDCCCSNVDTSCYPQQCTSQPMNCCTPCACPNCLEPCYSPCRGCNYEPLTYEQYACMGSRPACSQPQCNPCYVPPWCKRDGLDHCCPPPRTENCCYVPPWCKRDGLDHKCPPPQNMENVCCSPPQCQCETLNHCPTPVIIANSPCCVRPCCQRNGLDPESSRRKTLCPVTVVSLPPKPCPNGWNPCQRIQICKLDCTCKKS